VGGDVQAANDRILTLKVHPLDPPADWTEPTWLDLNGQPQDTTPVGWETTLEYWRALHEVVDTEPHLDSFGPLYGELAALGIAKGRPFAPDERMTRILEQAARLANGQLRVQSFADRRSDRVVWPGPTVAVGGPAVRERRLLRRRPPGCRRPREVVLPGHRRLTGHVRRAAGAGSLYWLGLRDADGTYLDGARTYRLSVPQPVPGKLFWSLTVYDAETRSQIQTDQNQAALRSLFELADTGTDAPAELWFGPEAPEGAQGRWIKTIPGRGWFVYFRIYGPDQPAFDGSWQLPDFQARS
jgi:hypothetical protein